MNINLTDPEHEFKIFNSEIGRYAAQSKLTPAEFFHARTCLSRGQLVDVDGEIMKPYKKIDFEMFNQVEEAYLRHKAENKDYEIGKAKIKAYLNPPPPEPSPEEKAKQRAQLKANIQDCFKNHGECEFAFLIYDEMKESGAIDQYRTPEAVAEIQDRLMRRFLAKELTRNLFYNPTDLKQLSDKFYAGEKYKLPDLVKQEIKNEILKCYFTSK